MATPNQNQQQPKNLFGVPFLTPDDDSDQVQNPQSIIDVTHQAMTEGLPPEQQASAIPQSYRSFAANPNNVNKALSTMQDAQVNPPSAPASPSAPAAPPVQSRDEFLAAHPAALPAAPPQYKGKRLAAMGLFAGLDSIGAALTHGRATVAPSLFENAQANEEYQRNLPVMKQNAENQAYDQYLSQQTAGANVGHLNAETANLQLMSPFYQQAAKLKDEIQQLWQSNTLRGADFDKAVALKLQGNPYARMISPDVIQQIKSLPQQKPYKLSMQDDLPTGVAAFGGETPIARDPKTGAANGFIVNGKTVAFNDPSLPPELQSAVPDITAADQAHQTKRGEKLQDETTVANNAAARQAAGFANQQSVIQEKAAQPKYDDAITADERLSRMESSYQKAKSGDQQAMLALLADHLGMTMGLQKGVRLNQAIINEAQQSQPWLDKIGAKFDSRGYLSGITLSPDQMKSMLELGYGARDRAWQTAFDASKLYGAPAPKGALDVYSKRTAGAKPALEPQGDNGQMPASATVVVVDPQGGKHYFKDQASANRFKTLAGIK